MEVVPHNPQAMGRLAEILPDRVKLPLSFVAEPLAEAVRTLDPDVWRAHFLRDNYDGEWSVLPLRCAAGETHPVRMIVADPTATDFVDTLFLEALPGFRPLLARFRCPLHSVRLMRLAPGSAIREHVDPGLSAEQGKTRLHLPIITNPGVEFHLNGRAVRMDAGTAWYLRFADPHRIANRGDCARVHLVIDAVVDAWLLEMLRAGSAD